MTVSRPVSVGACQHHGAALTDAERARRQRRRERDGLQHLRLDLPHAVIELLITERYMTESDTADRHAIERALETYLVDQIR